MSGPVLPPEDRPPLHYQDRHIAAFVGSHAGWWSINGVWDLPLVLLVPFGLMFIAATIWGANGLSETFIDGLRRRWEMKHPDAAKYLPPESRR